MWSSLGYGYSNRITVVDSYGVVTLNLIEQTANTESDGSITNHNVYLNDVAITVTEPESNEIPTANEIVNYLLRICIHVRSRVLLS